MIYACNLEIRRLREPKVKVHPGLHELCLRNIKQNKNKYSNVKTETNLLLLSFNPAACPHHFSKWKCLAIAPPGTWSNQITETQPTENYPKKHCPESLRTLSAVGTHRMWAYILVSQTCPARSGRGTWLGWSPSAAGQTPVQGASYRWLQGALPSLASFVGPQALVDWDLAEVLQQTGKKMK